MAQTECEFMSEFCRFSDGTPFVMDGVEWMDGWMAEEDDVAGGGGRE